jgi:hypothetical protein
MAQNKKYTVRVSYKVYDYYTIEAENEQEAIEQALETSATDSLNDFTQDGEGEAIVTMIGNKSVEPEKKANEIEVLFAVDSEDNTKISICAMHESGWKDGSKREAIEKAVRNFLGDILTEYIEDPYEAHINDKSEDEKKTEFDETISKLASGLSEDFLWYEFYWETVTEIK